MTYYNQHIVDRNAYHLAQLDEGRDKRYNATKAAPKVGAWLIIANDEPDQICYSEREARKERKDLEAMGCTVIVLPCITPGAAEELEAAIKYGPRSMAGAIRHARAMGDIVKGA